MPIYKYKCSNCSCEFEKFQKFSEEPLKTCPECGQDALHKVYTPVGIVFKGSGFYATDHRSPSGQTSHHAEGTSSEKSETSEKSTAETTPAASSESKSSESQAAPVKTAETPAKS